MNTTHHRGRLRVPDQPGQGLPVVLELADRYLVVSSDGEVLGKYPLSEVTANRMGEDRFDLTIGNERLLFVAEDPLSFSYEALPYVQRGGEGPGFKKRFRTLMGRRGDQAATPEVVDDEPIVEDRTIPETDLPAEPPPLGSVFPGAQSPEDLPADLPVEPSSVGSVLREDLPSVEPSAEQPPGQPPEEPIAEVPGEVASVVEVPLDMVEPAPLEPIDEASEVPPPTVEEILEEAFEEEIGQTVEATVVEPAAPPPEPAEPAPPATTDRNVAVAPDVPPIEAVEPVLGRVVPASLEGTGSAITTCRGLRVDGAPCGSTAVASSGYCFAHDPALAGERKLMEERVNQTALRARSLDPDLESLVTRLEQAVSQVHDGRLDPQQALAMASLVQAMCDTIGVAERHHPS